MKAITGDPATLMRRAQMAAAEYLESAIKEVNKILGKGYAQEHPELIAAFMKVAAADYGASIIAASIQSHAANMSWNCEDLAGAIRGHAGDMASAIESGTSHPLMGETLDGIGSALNQIAEAIKSEE